MTSIQTKPREAAKLNLNAIVAKLEAFHKKQSILCDRLESIADSLPDNVDCQEALIVARQILPILYEAHRFEENILFRLIENDESISHSLERLKFEHWEDEASGEDLTDALLSFAKNYKAIGTDKLAYMLRGFFDNLRRHIAFEAEHIVPAVMKGLKFDAHYYPTNGQHSL